MGRIKNIIIKMQDEDTLELDERGLTIIPDSVYIEEMQSRASRERADSAVSLLGDQLKKLNELTKSSMEKDCKD